MSNDPYTLAGAAAAALRAAAGLDSFDVALVMGSGWVPAADALGETVSEIPFTDLPGFSAPVVAGHGGKIRVVRTGAGRHALVFLGRSHLYEGRPVEAVVHGVRTAAAAGVRTIILTNAAGGLRPETQRVGDPVLISDHINMTGANPITGTTFIDLTEVYSKRLRALVREIDPAIAEGVYVAFRGPTYETPAEIRMLRTLGGDLIGMSTVLEAIAAREAGLDVLGLSLVTNPAAGLAGDPLDHEEVLQVGRATAARMGVLLAKVVDRL
ncbi:purine-nucleoside phosphorylase [Nonomuraea muscovyensis]|uniref:Purine nucleoside phosphorylase n=1 Tax=Nonomuraea muscovyensis TaxID=1124761 RepID=A0A7X0F260_9ACTN|nr:purine-nucleoside phosphorylase [Nonomuraea muscovyensis]MBB6350629.1 purine-nucleoside phosphorylase [Nonomuraea muscovyensis]MDF2710012.1 purine-nucleoside phosphorylase [Nonomuraea muscovyensis]